MKNKNFLLPEIAFVLLPFISLAQFDEFGAFAGVANYAGDLTERTFEPLELNLGVGFYARKRLTDRLGWQVHLYRGEISGSDAHSSSESELWKRNLHFHAELYEVGFQFEYDLFRLKDDYCTTSPYLFAGIAGFYFNPQTEMNGKTYNLHNYRTEDVEYSLFQFSVPFGTGLRLCVLEKGTLGLEFGFRKTFTDYLDDVSGSYPAGLSEVFEQNNLKALLSYRSPEVDSGAPLLPPAGSGRGNSKNKDWYMFFGVTVGILLK